MKQPRGKRREQERGFALLLIFLLFSLVAISLYMEMPRVAFETQRNREELTVDRGEQYKRAIQVFVRANKRYPSKIEDLESFNDKRYLRHRFINPMTGKDDWRFVHVGPNGVLTDSLVPTTNNNNPLGSKDGKDQSASNSNSNSNNSNTPNPNAPPPDPNTPNGFSAATVRPSDTMNLTNVGTGPPPGSDPNQPGVVPVAQTPQQPVAQYPGQPGVQPFPGQQQPGQVFPGVNPGQPGTQPGVLPYPGQPGQPVQYPGQQPGATPYPGIPTTTPGQTDPNTGQPYNTPPPNTSSPQMNAPGGFPGAATSSNSNSSGSSNTAISAINKSIFGAAPTTSAFNSPQNGMGSGIAGVGLPAESKGKGIMIIKERSKYREWEFIYDPKDDKSVVGAQAAQMNQTPVQQGNGPNGSSSTFGGSSTFSSGSSFGSSSGSSSTTGSSNSTTTPTSNPNP